MIDTQSFCEYLANKKFRFFVGVPDSLLKEFCAFIQEAGSTASNIITANEGNAVAIAGGYHITTGRYAVVYMQNSGIGNAINPILSLIDADVYRIPMLFIIGWRGEPGTKDEPQHIAQGRLTLPLLETLGIEYLILNDNFETQIDTCCSYMKETNKPIALVVQKGSFSEYGTSKPKKSFAIKREDALEEIIENISEDSIVVSTTGKTSREIFEIRKRRHESHALDFLTVGSMGHTSAIALGMSFGTDRDVYCVDGDGSFLMHLGGIAVTAKTAPSNFKYILINNGAHESVGGQPTIALEINIERILKAMGFFSVATAFTREEVAAGIAEMSEQRLNALIIKVNQGSRSDLGRPTITPEQNKLDMMKEVRKGD
jgi:phosphonopyruvate decarboxylase